ncbi:MAG: tetratricopeptide repeat protein [Candidatus Eisenbacteria bacterium]
MNPISNSTGEDPRNRGVHTTGNGSQVNRPRPSRPDTGPNPAVTSRPSEGGGGRHPSSEDLAALCEMLLPGPTDGVDATRIPAHTADHLADCHECAAALEEAVRIRASWLSGSTRTPIEGELRSLALRQGEEWARTRRAELQAATAAADPTTHSPSLLPRILRWLALPGVVAAVGVWFLSRPPVGLEEPSYAPPEILRAAVADASRTGLILPGAENTPANDAQYRSGSSISPALKGILDEDPLAAGSRGAGSGDGSNVGRAAIDATIWNIAGELSVSRNRIARAELDSALHRHPDEPKLRTLLAIAQYRQNDLAGAERELRATLELDPGDAVARFDLAYVLFEAGRRDDALAEVAKIESTAGTQLSRRVGELQAALGRVGTPRLK